MITGRHTVPPPGRIGENVSVDVMSQLDSWEVERGPPHGWEYILRRGEEWAALALACSSSLFSSSTPCLFPTISLEGLQSPCHLYPQCLAQPGTLQVLLQYLKGSVHAKRDTAHGYLYHYQKQHKSFKYMSSSHLLGYQRGNVWGKEEINDRTLWCTDANAEWKIHIMWSQMRYEMRTRKRKIEDFLLYRAYKMEAFVKIGFDVKMIAKLVINI